MSADGSGAGVAVPALAGATVTLAGAALVLRPGGAVYWPDEGLLCVADLHLGRAERLARRGGALLPPYETRDTLDRLAAEIDTLAPRRVVCLGDSFDDGAAAAALERDATARLAALAAGRRWVWIAGNHDPGPPALAGNHRAELRVGSLIFRHLAADGAAGEVLAHYHPKARLRGAGLAVSRPCFLADRRRLILPAFGTYTGGLDAADPTFDRLLAPGAWAYLTGRRVLALPRARLGA